MQLCPRTQNKSLTQNLHHKLLLAYELNGKVFWIIIKNIQGSRQLKNGNDTSNKCVVSFFKQRQQRKPPSFRTKTDLKRCKKKLLVFTKFTSFNNWFASFGSISARAVYNDRGMPLEAALYSLYFNRSRSSVIFITYYYCVLVITKCYFQLFGKTELSENWK